MKATATPAPAVISKNLHQLVGLAADNSMSTAVKRHSFIINEVPPEFKIATDEEMLSLILNSLVSTVVSNTEHSCIRIKANEYEDIVFVSIRDNSSYSANRMDNNMDIIKMLAKKMNGNVIVRNMEDKFTTILLSFPNFPIAE